MQQAAPFKTQLRHILVVGMRDGEARQDGIAVVTVVIDDIAAISCRLPNVFGQKIVLRGLRPVLVPFGVPEMQALHFLQKNNIRPQYAQTLAQIMHSHVPIELRKTFVNIVGRHMQQLGHWSRLSFYKRMLRTAQIAKRAGAVRDAHRERSARTAWLERRMDKRSTEGVAGEWRKQGFSGQQVCRSSTGAALRPAGQGRVDGQSINSIDTSS